MTISPAEITVVVPAHNEERSVGNVVRGLKERVGTVIVVDDASIDDTSGAARAAGAIVLRNVVNRGYDGSLDCGFAEAARRGAALIVTFDADGEHDVADIPLVCAPILGGVADVVAGQRPHIRHWGELLFSLYSRVRLGMRDPLCGLKAYRRSVYDAIGRFDTVRSIGTELMLRAHARGFRVVSIPIVLHERVSGTSRFYQFNLRGNLRVASACLRVLFLR